MNVTDVKEEIKVPDSIWKEIFDKQWKLAEKYKDIEGMGNLLEPKFLKINIDTQEGQKWIKDFAWRVTEELAEADEAKKLWEKEDDKELAEQYYTHYLEELIDALHFLVELCIIAGYKQEIVPLYVPHCDYETTSPWEVTYNLGLMCNCLKNKPWKQTQMLTDRPKFYGFLRLAWEALICIYKDNDMEDIDVYNLYFKKNAVNQFRIRSKY